MSKFTLVSVLSDDRVLCKVISAAPVPLDAPPDAVAVNMSEMGRLPYHTNFDSVEFKDTAEMLEVLDELRAHKGACVVRAEPLSNHPIPCRRLLHSDALDAATMEDVPRDWALLDFDSLEAPPGVYFAAEPARAAEYLRSLLPLEFRAVSMVWRASSSAGIKDGIRMHLWVRLSTPLLGAQLFQWLKDAPIDRSPFRAVQPHFTADPVFEDVVDPMAARIGLLAGAETVDVPQWVIDWKPAPVQVTATNVDPQTRAALAKWTAERADYLADFAPGSTRHPCPACGSSDGIAVREDGRWNCHGNKHDGSNVGTPTGNVYVGHPCEFVENIPRGTLRKWLTERYPQCFKFGEGLAERMREANAAKVVALADSLNSLVEGGPTDVEKPSVRELERAALELKRAAHVVKGNPSLLVDMAASLGRYVPLFLASKQVHEALLDAALESSTTLVNRPEAEDQIAQGMLVGREQPIMPRQRVHAGLSYDEQGRLNICYPNVLALVADISDEIVAWDERGLRAVVLKAPPWREDDDREFPRPVDDADFSLLTAFLAGDRYRYPHATPVACATALETVAHGLLWDPVREYLDGLVWEDSLDDARELLGSIWIAWAGAVDDAYTRVVSMRWMLAAVQRTYEPGCTQREVLTLIGPQNIGKSRMLAALCPAQTLFCDTCDADGTKDSRETLLGTWIVELAEVDKHIKEEKTGAFKNFLSTPSDKFRRAYARAGGDYPRRVVFAATTNETAPFKDRTGNTRFNVLHVTRGDAAAVAAARDELWAAAVALYRAGEPAWLQGDERVVAATLQRAAYATSTLEERLEDLWECPAPKLDAGARWGGDSPLGFTWDPAQIDAERIFLVLTSEQIAAYLECKGVRVTMNTARNIAQFCETRGLLHGRVTRSIKSLRNQKGFWRTDFKPEPGK